MNYIRAINSLRKGSSYTAMTEKYEDITVEQANYMNNISNLIKDSQKHLKNLDEKGVFQSDDEVGYFFDNLKKVQENFDQYQLSDNYAQKEIQS